jgi:hypothetical protein
MYIESAIFLEHSVFSSISSLRNSTLGSIGGVMI